MKCCGVEGCATSCAVRPSSVGQTACAPAPATETMSGTPITAAPEATAERSPFGESSIATMSAGVDAERRARLQVRVREGLGPRRVVARDDDVERLEVDEVDDGVAPCGASTSSRGRS